MRSPHNDSELMLATQIAYLNIPPGENVREWITSHVEEYMKSGNVYLNRQADAMNHILNMEKNPNYRVSGWDSWKVADRVDNEHGSGMYGCVIDTGRGDAIIGFRGTESVDKEQKIKDWGFADFGLLNNNETFQQGDTRRYMQYVNEKYGDRYGTFDVTGHSLGGNLAVHATITAPVEMRDKIGRSVSYDGPGFSDEYLISHGEGIAAMGGKIDHYAWSWCGSLLFPIPGSHYRVIQARNPSDREGTDQLLWRHDTPNVVFQNGHVVDGERDVLATILDPLSKGVEIALTKPSTIALATSLGLVMVVRNGAIVIGKWFSDLFASFTNANGEFSVQPSVVSESVSELERFESASRHIAQEVQEIAGSLQYESLSGWHYKNKIRSLGRGIEADSESSHRLKDALQFCGDNYRTVDHSVGESLAI